MAWRLVDSLKQLLAEANAAAPHRNKENDGTIGDTAHQSRSSDHNPEPDGTVDAIDLTNDPAGGWNCSLRVAQIIGRRDRRVKYLIWNHRICAGNAGPDPWTWRPYSGKNPHDHHMHVSVEDAFQDDRSPWFEGAAVEDELTKEEHDALARIDADTDNVAVILNIVKRLESAVADLQKQAAATTGTFQVSGELKVS